MAEKVAVVKCGSYEQREVGEAVKKALKLIDFKFKKNLRVLLKPNLLSPKEPERGVTTHPSIVEALCKILKKFKAEIFIGDSSSYGTKEALEISGMKKVAEKYGAKLINFETVPLIMVRDNKATQIKEFYIPRIVKEVDLIINLPKLKTHALTKYTGAVKNLFGCIPGGKKSECHKIANTEEKFSELLVDIYQNIKPALTIMDGVIGMDGQGPAAGSLKKTNLILASKDCVALDIVAAEIVGFRTFEILTNKIAIQRDLYPNINVNVVGERNIHVEYKKPINLERIKPIVSAITRMLPERKISIDKNKCIKCGICVKHCPVRAMKMNKFPVIDRKKCIKCYCCMEICPEGAVILKEPLQRKGVKFVRNIFEKF